MRIVGFLGAWLLASVVTLAMPALGSAQEAAAPAAAPDAQATAAAPAPGDEEQARAHFRLGRAHYDNGNFAQAAAEFEEAYRISQRSALLYNLYLAYRDANDTRNAAVALRKYLELEKEVENRGQLEARLAALERSLADGTAPQPAAAAAPAAAPTEQAPAADAAPAPNAAPAAATAPDAAAKADEGPNLLPWILMGSGGAIMVGGLVVGSIASGKHSDLEALLDKNCPSSRDNCKLSDENLKTANDLKSSGESLNTVADIMLFGGLAVAGTGAVLFVLDQMSGSESDAQPAATTASVACVPGLCGATFRTAF